MVRAVPEELQKRVRDIEEDVRGIKKSLKSQDEVHTLVLDDLAEIKLKLSGKDRYEKGLKDGAAWLWVIVVSAGAAIVAWFQKGNGT